MEGETSQEMTLGEQINDHTQRIESQIHYLEKITEPKANPPVVQELVLARRHMEDASHRLVQAYNKLNEEEK